MSEAKFIGGCFCGSVRYEARGEVSSLCICHCTSCRRATGALMVPWGTVAAAGFSVMRGRLSEYRSSPDVTRGFCAACGTSLTYHHARRGDEIDIALTTLDDPAALVPAAHIWVKDKLSWEIIGDGRPQFDTVHEEAAVATSVVPAGWHAVTPRIVVRDPEALVEFIKDVFGAAGEVRASGPAEMRIGDSVMMVSEAGVRPPSPAFLYVYVGDLEATYERALERGARSLEAPTDMHYGDRRCMIEDAWGNTWQIATRLAK